MKIGTVLKALFGSPLIFEGYETIDGKKIAVLRSVENQDTVKVPVDTLSSIIQSGHIQLFDNTDEQS